ncbi:MAG: YjgP/YjgQ family permease [Flavobacteriaceae bacterium]|nr:YjgP/YjgQ family permease [Flavobacteriaceae bacterium]
MKILDRYILTAYLKTFFSVFIILMFIFVLQTIWLYISELAGKDLDIWVVLKFLWYVSPRLIPLVLPLTILVTSLMVFGSFAEKYEFAAMKSTGISLQRAMRSLTYFILGLAVLAFFFANNVIPYSEYKWQNLRRNIAQVSPSMAIVEGQFSSIGDNFNIKVEEKFGDKEQFLKNVVIHQKDPKSPSKNTKVTIAKEGELASAEGSNTLSLILKDGNYYEDVQVKNVMKQRNRPFAKSYFEKYTINLDLTELNDTDIDKENDLSNHNMYKIDELYSEIDRLSESYTRDINLFADNMYYRAGITKVRDTTHRIRKQDTTYLELLDYFNSGQKLQIVSTAIDNSRGTLQTLNAKKMEFQRKTKALNKHEIALHEKYILAIACIILFFVGAPLGAIIRKGGMGLPMVVAVLLFLTYHFIGIFAKNSAEDGTMHPFIASWLSTVIMLPLGIWLTYRATTDQGIIDIDSFLQRIGRLFKRSE